MTATPWALLPALLAIVLTLITKEVYSSLLAGIALGALFVANFNPVQTIDLIVVDGLSQSVSDLAGNLCFLVMLGTIVAMVSKSGGSAAFGRWAQRHIKSRVGAQLATLALGVMIL